MNNFKTLYFRSGVSHQIDFYPIDAAHFIRNRNRNEYILTDNSIQPSLIIPQATALNEYSQETTGMDVYGICLNLPRSEGSIEIVSDFYRFDCIIVSSRYAEAAIRKQHQISPDYADRLFVIDQVVKDRNGKKIGCCSFRKVFWFQAPEFYINAFAANANPSLASARQCYEYFSNQIGVYPNLRDKIYHLGNLISSEEARRATPQQYVFNV